MERQRGQRYELQQAIKRADSIYNALRQGADFAVLARQVSQDKASAANGGLMGWYGRNQLLKEMEDNAFTLQPGTYSRPFLTADGYHILLLNDRRTADKFAELQQWQAAEQKRLSMVRGISSSPIQASLPSAERESNMGNSPISPMATASLPTVSDDIYEGLLLCVLSEKSLDQCYDDRQSVTAELTPRCFVRPSYRLLRPRYRENLYPAGTSHFPRPWAGHVRRG